MKTKGDSMVNLSYVPDVLYFSKGVPLPLMYCYHGAGSTYLATSIPTLPISTITEVESAYCPQCLNSWDASTAFSVAKGRCCVLDKFSTDTNIGCIKCPECLTILVSSVTKKSCTKITSDSPDFTHVIMFQCGYCQWSSIECDVYHLTKIYDSMDINAIIHQSSKEVQTMMSKKITYISNYVFKDTLSVWNTKVSEEEKRKRRNESISRIYSPYSVDANKISFLEENQDCKPLSFVQLLDNRIQKRSDLIKRLVEEDVLQNVKTLKISSNDPDKTCSESAQDAEQLIILSRNYKKPNLPFPVHLRTKYTRRCCEEQKLGRPGILIKTKMNPLEGDTSIRYGQGQWWKKDSSAAHNVPRVIIKASHTNHSTGYNAFLLFVKNHSHGQIRMRIHSNFDDNTSFPLTYRNVVIDPISLETAFVEVISPSKSANVMEIFTLGGMEDSLLDSGECSRFDYSSWSYETIDWTCDSVTKLIRLDRDSAWVEFIVKDTSSDASFRGSPLSMDIEIGEGSWESSMIQPISSSERKTDFVSLTLLPTWKSK